MSENYYSNTIEGGSINISEDVVATLVKNAVEETENASLSNTAGGEITELLSKKSAAKGIKIQFGENETVVDVVITANYGKNITEIAAKVQENVSNAVSTAVNTQKITVNVHVTGIAF